MKYRYLILLFYSLLMGACTHDMDSPDSNENKYIKFNINTLYTIDPYSVNNDQYFSSLAIYLFNGDNDSLEKSALLPSFAPVATHEIGIETEAGNKVIYFIANYVGKTFRTTTGTLFTLTPATTRLQLENIITETTTGFDPTSLLMISKEVFIVGAGDNGKNFSINLRRLQSRIDVHVYKGSGFGAGTVTLQSVRLYNQIRNSEVGFDYPTVAAQMLMSPQYYSEIVSPTSTLSAWASGTVLNPTDAEAIFYSYQNLVGPAGAIQVGAPYLELKLLYNNTQYTYKGYLTDANQTQNKYSLLQNNLYQIVAIPNLNSKMALQIQILPWNCTNIDYQKPVTAPDFVFGAWNSSWGGSYGKTMNTNVGTLEDCVFQFELKAPIGAAWTATLTNGLDFGFTSTTAGTTTTAVSKGFANPGSPALIAVRALKRWTGSTRDTEFYITVDGKEIPINPVVGSQRLYQGTDTRIKITQVASYN